MNGVFLGGATDKNEGEDGQQKGFFCNLVEKYMFQYKFVLQ